MNILVRPVLALCIIFLAGIHAPAQAQNFPQVCCSYTDAAGNLRYFLAPKTQCPKKRVAPPENCKSTPERQVCCLTHNGYFKTSGSRCKAAGGTVENNRYCDRPNEPICCKTPNGYQKLIPNRCNALNGQPANPRHCERTDRKVCCQTPNGYYDWTASMCRRARGKVVDGRHCKRICCKYTKPDGTVVHEFHNARRCRQLRGKKVSNRYCVKLNRDLKLKRNRELKLRRN